ncbi:MAG TPA: hypothetical protein VHO71_06860, partial [Caproiciproducens sp.]|nr:hypothetical protein [Caproiciproducens sp.]
MKKLFALILSVCVLLVSVPVSANAIADDTQVINKHGTRTYMGAYSAWNDNSWDSENFTDVTGENVETSDNLIIKGGKVGNVSVDDSADVTIYDGTAADVTCDGCITMAGGSANSLKSSQDINISGGLVQKNVEAEQAVTLTGKLTVCGGVTGNDVTVYSSTGGSDMTAVTGTVSFSDLMTLEGKNYKFGGVDGQSSGTITLSDLTGTLPTLSNTTGIRVKSGSTVTADKSLDFGSLFIEDGGVFLANSSLQVGTLGGPGTLLVKSGSLTVTSAVSDHPILDFNGTAGNGTNVFRASSGTVAPGDVTVCGYSLTKTANSDGYDYFSLAPSKGDGVSLSPSSVTVKSG